MFEDASVLRASHRRSTCRFRHGAIRQGNTSISIERIAGPNIGERITSTKAAHERKRYEPERFAEQVQVRRSHGHCSTV